MSAELAAIQTTIVADALEVSRAKAHITCPTYYSDDSVLVNALGGAPDDYLQQFGATLNSSVDIFWTAPKVCTQVYTPAHLRDVAVRLGRKPFIWDNYPVNDGPRMCKPLHLRAVDARRALLEESAGFAANPMNQAGLTKILLATFSTDQLTRFKDKYGEHDTPISREIMRWLVGRFEPSAELTAEFEEFGQHKDAR